MSKKSLSFLFLLMVLPFRLYGMSCSSSDGPFSSLNGEKYLKFHQVSLNGYRQSYEAMMRNGLLLPIHKEVPEYKYHPSKSTADILESYRLAVSSWVHFDSQEFGAFAAEELVSGLSWIRSTFERALRLQMLVQMGARSSSSESSLLKHLKSFADLAINETSLRDQASVFGKKELLSSMNLNELYGAFRMPIRGTVVSGNQLTTIDLLNVFPFLLTESEDATRVVIELREKVIRKTSIDSHYKDAFVRSADAFLWRGKNKLAIDWMRKQINKKEYPSLQEAEESLLKGKNNILSQILIGSQGSEFVTRHFKDEIGESVILSLQVFNIRTIRLKPEVIKSHEREFLLHLFISELILDLPNYPQITPALIRYFDTIVSLKGQKKIISIAQIQILQFFLEALGFVAIENQALAGKVDRLCALFLEKYSSFLEAQLPTMHDHPENYPKVVKLVEMLCNSIDTRGKILIDENYATSLALNRILDLSIADQKLSERLYLAVQNAQTIMGTPH